MWVFMGARNKGATVEETWLPAGEFSRRPHREEETAEGAWLPS